MNFNNSLALELPESRRDCVSVRIHSEQDGCDALASAEGTRLKIEAGSRILIVDDTRAIHDDFRKILVSDDENEEFDLAEQALFGESAPSTHTNRFTLDSAYQGEEAFALIQQAMNEGRRYAMAFIDVRMPPGWDGVKTTRKLWEIDPDLQVVICTAYSDHSWEEIIGQIGNSDRLVILKKPFDTVEALQLANALTEKWSLLQQTRRKMGDLEKLVAERTAHLEAEVAERKRREHYLMVQQKVSRVLASSMATLGEVTGEILQIICEGMNWDLGVLWTVDRNAQVLRAAATWHSPGEKFSEANALIQQMIFTRTVGLPGHVWECEEAIWISDFNEDERSFASFDISKAGLHSAFAFPIRLQGEVLGVLEFLSGPIRQPENDLIQFFAVLDGLIGQSLERKKLEEQLRHAQKMDAIGYLAGGVAHDFNNILTVILGYTQIVGAKADLDEKTLDGLHQITQAAHRASSLTGQLLTFSRKQVMQMTELNLNKVIKNLAKMLHRIISEDIALKVDCCTEPAFVQADEDSLGQVLMNLTVNARSAMPRGGKLEINTRSIMIDEVDLSRHPEARIGNFFCLSVSDTGCGITPENLERIFEPFFTTKAVGEGTGLGLATVHGIVAQHQGWIEVSSQVGAGTTFKIFLPRIVASEKAARSSVDELEIVTGAETILLVEDEAAVRELVQMVLTQHGYDVLEATSGIEALRIWEKHGSKIDLLLTDIIMPGGLNGRELALKLRTKRPGLNTLFTSGYDPDKVGLENELGNEIHFLPKPYSPQRLLQAIRHCLAFKAN